MSYEVTAEDDFDNFAMIAGAERGAAPVEVVKEEHNKEGAVDSPGPESPNQLMKGLRRLFRRYTSLKLAGVLLGIYIAIMSYAYVGTFGPYGGFVDPERGYIVDVNSDERNAAGVILTKGTERAIVANNWFQMVCIGVTRVSAFFMYPGTLLVDVRSACCFFSAMVLTIRVVSSALIMVFITKFRATMNFISKTPFSLYTNADLHDFHVCCGWIVMVDGVIHAIFHVLRWGNQGNLSLLFTHYSGISGVLVVTTLLLICIPMIYFVGKVSYELRKALHYLFVIFCLAMAAHSPTSTIPNGGFTAWVFPILLAWYSLDYLYIQLFMTEKIESTVFHVVPTGFQLTMKVSDRFQQAAGHGGYCYVNFPWISKTQWHAYSLFENPANPGERQIFVQTLGDWTQEVHDALQRNTCRPVWVQGPFSSPYDSAVEYDNQILVAGGIGITPAISVMRAHQETRRSNLIWAVRDRHMLEFFIQHGEFSKRGWNLLYYTGKEPLVLDDYDDDGGEIIAANGARLHIVRGRPDLAKVLPNLIYSIESGTAVPEAFVEDKKVEVMRMLQEKLVDLDEDEELGDREKLQLLINHSSSLGFLFTDIAHEFFGSDLPDVAQCLAGRKDKVGSPSPECFRSSGRLLLALRSSSRPGSLSSSGASLRHSGATRQSSLLTAATWTKLVEKVADQEVPDSFKPWIADQDVSSNYVRSLDPAKTLSTWGILYCGGKSPLADMAVAVAKDYGIDTHIESFAW